MISDRVFYVIAETCVEEWRDFFSEREAAFQNDGPSVHQLLQYRSILQARQSFFSSLTSSAWHEWCGSKSTARTQLSIHTQRLLSRTILEILTDYKKVLQTLHRVSLMLSNLQGEWQRLCFNHVYLFTLSSFLACDWAVASSLYFPQKAVFSLCCLCEEVWIVFTAGVFLPLPSHPLLLTSSSTQSHNITHTD